MPLPANRHLLMAVTLLALAATAICALLLARENANSARIDDLLRRIETLESTPARSNAPLQQIETNLHALNAELGEVRQNSARLLQELAELENRRAALARELQNIKSGSEP